MPLSRRTVLALALLASPANAVSPEAQKLCARHGMFAEEVMKSRQSGVPLSAMLSTVDAESTVAEAARQIILTAFETRRYFSPDMQQRAVEEHREKYELICFKRFSKR